MKLDAVRAKFYSTVFATLPDLTRIYDASEAELRNWRDLVQIFDEGGQALEGLEPPWCAVEFGAAQPTNGEYGIASDYQELTASVFLIYDWNKGGGVIRTVEEMLQKSYGDAQLAVDAIWNAKGNEYGMVQRPRIDGSTDNPANAVFLEARTPLVGVLVEAQVIVGGLLVAGVHET